MTNHGELGSLFKYYYCYYHSDHFYHYNYSLLSNCQLFFEIGVNVGILFPYLQNINALEFPCVFKSSYSMSGHPCYGPITAVKTRHPLTRMT